MTNQLRTSIRGFRTRIVLAAAIACAGAHPAAAQVSDTVGAFPPPSAPRPEDVADPDAVTTALYESISGPAGQRRDWERFRSLFLPGARLIISRARRDSSGAIVHAIMTPDFYAANSSALEEGGFFEREVAHTSERFGRVVHRFSTYESRGRAEDPRPFGRGINSIQMMWDGTRWWVVTVLWDFEGPNNPIPERYLPR
ncbi:MAG TPA: hypothetical protein VGB66_14800 [Longimicrobium sp.]